MKNANDFLNQKQLLHKSNLWVIYIMPDNIIFYDCVTTSGDATKEEYKRESLKLGEVIKSYKCEFVIADATNFRFPIDPEIQDWVKKDSYPLWEAAGVKKTAIIMPSDFIASLGTEQLVDEIGCSFLTKYTGSLQESIDWFFP